MSDPVDHSRSRAILIGTSRYDDPAFPPLPAVANSLRGMRDALTDAHLCGWPAERTTVIADPTDARRLTQTIRRLAQETTGTLLMYFVGHGTIVRRGQLCLVLSDTEASDPDVTGLEYERVREALLDSPARTKIVILDCCYSGRAIEALSGGSTVADSTDTRGVYTLTASDHTAHVVSLDQQANVPTSFTGELLSLIHEGVVEGPDVLSLGLIYQHLRRRLQARSLPAPNQRGTDTADLFRFTKNAAISPPDRPMTVIGVRVEIPSEQPIVLLKEAVGDRYLPIWIGPVEATAIAYQMQGVEQPVPLTHDLFANVLTALDINLDRVTIRTLVDSVYYTYLCLNGIEVQCRPSDGIALALRTGATVYVTEEIMADVGIIIDDSQTG